VQQREDEVTKVLLEDAAALAGSDVEAAADSRSKQGNALGASASESVHELYVNFRNKQLQQASVIHDDVDGTTGRNANPHQFLISALKSVAAEKQAADNRAGELEGRVLSLERAHKDEIRELRSLLDHERRAAASASEASASKLVAESEMKLQEQAERLGCEHGKAVEKLEREKEELAEEVARWRDVEYAKLQDELGRFEAEVLPRLFTKEDVEERIEHAVKQEQHRCEELAKEKLQQVKGTWKAKKEKTEAKLLEDIAELKSELQESKVHAEATEQLALAGKTTITDIEGENLELKAKIGKMAAAEFAWQTEKDGWGKDKQVLERKCEILETYFQDAKRRGEECARACEQAKKDLAAARGTLESGRKDIAALQRKVADLERRLGITNKQGSKVVHELPEEVQDERSSSPSTAVALLGAPAAWSPVRVTSPVSPSRQRDRRYAVARSSPSRSPLRSPSARSWTKMERDLRKAISHAKDKHDYSQKVKADEAPPDSGGGATTDYPLSSSKESSSSAPEPNANAGAGRNRSILHAAIRPITASPGAREDAIDIVPEEHELRSPIFSPADVAPPAHQQSPAKNDFRNGRGSTRGGPHMVDLLLRSAAIDVELRSGDATRRGDSKKPLESTIDEQVARIEEQLEALEEKNSGSSPTRHDGKNRARRSSPRPGGPVASDGFRFRVPLSPGSPTTQNMLRTNESDQSSTRRKIKMNDPALKMKEMNAQLRPSALQLLTSSWDEAADEAAAAAERKANERRAPALHSFGFLQKAMSTATAVKDELDSLSKTLAVKS